MLLKLLILNPQLHRCIIYSVDLSQSIYLLSLKIFCYVPAPSKPPSGFIVNASTSSSVTASWRLPPKDSRNGIIRGFKLFINKKGSGDTTDVQFIDVFNASVYTKTVTGLQVSKEYEFQVLAYTFAGDGPKSSVHFVKMKEAGRCYVTFSKDQLRATTYS